ncbi:glycosyltransferase [Stutzerimonas stutzeri]|nr:glycosyltransferase [Stutzerimonas stutzeri]
MFNPVAVIPHYNHSATLGAVLAELHRIGLPVLVIDDGSTELHRQVLQTFAQEGVKIYYRTPNQGKGGAMKAGLLLAAEQGFTHALQVDADGQHNLADCPAMLAKSQENPSALICGRPIYGDDAPKARLYGRKITDFWNAVHTHSFDIKDGMCGFRIYPLATIAPLIRREFLGDRMDFDIEILVKAHWHRIEFIWLDTRIRYAQDGVSHFRSLADNWLISKMHARLFFAMLKRFLMGKM